MQPPAPTPSPSPSRVASRADVPESVLEAPAPPRLPHGAAANPPSSAELALAAAWVPTLAQAFVGLACELVLVLDEQGRVLSVAGSDAPGREAADRAAWVGQPWSAMASADSHDKVRALLADVASQGVARRRELTLATHPPQPMAFAALRLGPGGPILALGHDLRAAAGLQQRFLLAQRELEQGYQQALDQLVQSQQDRDARQALEAAHRVAPPQAVRAMVSLLPTAARLLARDAGAEPRTGPAGKRPTKRRTVRRR